MKINLNLEDKTVINIILEDLVNGSELKKDKKRRKYATKLQNKFNIQSEVIHCKLNELILIANLVNQALQYAFKQKIDEEEQKEIHKDNIKLMVKTYENIKQIIDTKI